MKDTENKLQKLLDENFNNFNLSQDLNMKSEKRNTGKSKN